MLAAELLHLGPTLVPRDVPSGHGSSRTPQPRTLLARWAIVVLGGVVGGIAGVAGAAISEPGVGFPARVELTGVAAGFGVGASAVGLVLRRRFTTDPPDAG